jgi:AraC-like DNA-binding protein
VTVQQFTASVPTGFYRLERQAEALILRCEATSSGAAGGNDPVMLLPREMLAPYLPGGSRGDPIMVPLSSAPGSVLSACFDAMTRQSATSAGPSMHAAMESVCRLIGAISGDSRPGERNGRRFAAAITFIDENLSDPDLTPSMAAKALGISLRGLHALFSSQDDSFARYVLRRRLRACRTALLSCPGRSVTDIAFAWGFRSLSSFYRGFQNEFDMAPGELRAAHGYH